MCILLAKQNASNSLLKEVLLTCPSLPAREVAPGVIEIPHLVPADFPHLFPVAFSRQALPRPSVITAHSIRMWVDGVTDRIITALDTSPQLTWALHVYDPSTVEDGTIRNRQRLIREGVIEFLQKKRRSLLKRLVDVPTSGPCTLVQVLCITPTSGYTSIDPLEGSDSSQRYLSPYVAGYLSIPDDKAPPSRAFKKLSEALTLRYTEIHRGDSVVDLGASPGGWTHVAVARGAEVTAVDRSPLEDKLMRSKHVRWIRADAFTWTPASPVDLLLCDVIAEPARTEGLIRTWVGNKWCKRFVVTMKFKGEPDVGRIISLKAWSHQNVKDFLVSQLVNNRNEITWIGRVF